MSETLIGKTKADALTITETYLQWMANQPYDDSVDLGEAIVYQGVRQFPARIKCASIAWKALEGTLKESE
jgi:NifU-like protein involved in Fe-S cluster formation